MSTGVRHGAEAAAVRSTGFPPSQPSRSEAIVERGRTDAERRDADVRPSGAVASPRTLSGMRWQSPSRPAVRMRMGGGTGYLLVIVAVVVVVVAAKSKRTPLHRWDRRRCALRGRVRTCRRQPRKIVRRRGWRTDIPRRSSRRTRQQLSVEEQQADASSPSLREQHSSSPLAAEPRRNGAKGPARFQPLRSPPPQLQASRGPNCSCAPALAAGVLRTAIGRRRARARIYVVSRVCGE